MSLTKRKIRKKIQVREELNLSWVVDGLNDLKVAQICEFLQSLPADEAKHNKVSNPHWASVVRKGLDHILSYSGITMIIDYILFL